MQKTALHDKHVKLGAKMTDFHGWDMPLYYQSILDEHAAVRQAAGLFDISHMGQVLVSGAGALETLNALVVSDVAQVGVGRACYTMLTNEQGGIVDDLIIYRVGALEYLVIINCGNRAIDVEWITRRATPQTGIEPISDGRAILALQGPQAAAVMSDSLGGVDVKRLGRFDLMAVEALGSRGWLARTGYTGSDGFEVFCDDAHAVRLWSRLLAPPSAGLERGRTLGVLPAGLGARDTLRLEAGLRLYGTDMSDSTTPYEADLGWTVAVNKPFFLGKDALARQKASGVAKKLVGFELAGGPVPRHDCQITAGGRPLGAVTSGTFSIMLGKPIGMGYIEAAAAKPGTAIQVVIRAKAYPATIVKMPFWRKHEAPPSAVPTAERA